MKKRYGIVIAILLILLCIFGLAACNNTHAHDYIHHNAETANCGKNGNHEYWSCTDCDKLFSDELGTEITDPSSVIIPATGEHTLSKWSSNESEHWHDCSVCEQKVDFAAHNWAVVSIVSNPTCIADGEKIIACSICGQSKTEIIPATGEHTLSKWSSNGSEHWHDCSVCGQKVDVAQHVWGEKVCTICGIKKFTEGLSYTLSNGAYTVKGLGAATETDIYIPDEYDGYPVTSIGVNAFDGCSGLTSIVIPTSVTSIGGYAFYNCSGLTNITIPDGVTSIGDSAFSGCSGPTNITIPDGVMSIGYHTFYNCSGLTSITIPNSVTSIGESAFADCSGVNMITVNSGNINYHSVGNCLIETGTRTLIVGCKTSVIPTDGSVTIIGNEAFSNCIELTNIIIPNSVTSIGRSAFYRCSGLTSISIPDSVQIIDSSAFAYCSEITSITIPNSVQKLGISVLSHCSGLTSISIPFVGGYEFNNTYKTYKGNFGFIFGTSHKEDNAKWVPKSLKHVVITGGTDIVQEAFYGCSSLVSVSIPKSVQRTGGWLFKGCTSFLV